MHLRALYSVITLLATFFLYACTTLGESSGGRRTEATGEDWVAMVHVLAGEMRLDMSGPGLDTIAVLDFSAEETHAGFAAALGEELTAAFRSGGIRVVEREAIARVMAEQEFQISGSVDDNTAKSIGRIIGVDMLCYGRIGDFPDFVRVSFRVIEVESGELLSIRNIELAKTPRLMAYLSGGGRQEAGRNSPPVTASAASPQARRQSQASPAAPAPNATVAAIPERRPALEIGGNDMRSEAGQIAAVRRFIPFVVDNLWEIRIVSVEPIGNSRDKPDVYSVKLVWEYKENYETVRAMADFYRLFPVQLPSGGGLSTGNGNLVLRYFPTPYASRVETVAIRMHPSAERLMRSHAAIGFRWEITFVLFDTGSLPIDRFSDRITLSSSPGQLGRLGQTREHTFRMSREAYENMDNVQIVNIVGGIPQMNGSLLR